MKVMVIVKASESSERGDLPSEQLLTEMGNYNEELVKAGVMLAGEGLHPSSNGKRVLFSGKNRVVLDGPFAETKELIAGFWLWKVASMDEAVEWLKKCPNPMTEDSEIEIRQVFSAEDFGEAFTPELREQEASLRAQTLGLAAPRFENVPAMILAGLNERYTPQTRSQIGAQWDRFSHEMGKLPGQIGKFAYGVSWNSTPEGAFDYLSGAQITDPSSLPAKYQHLRLPAQRYVIFPYSGPIADIAKTIDTIWMKWAPDCGLKLAGDICLERYTEEFTPATSAGTEIWIPLAA